MGVLEFGPKLGFLGGKGQEGLFSHRWWSTVTFIYIHGSLPLLLIPQVLLLLIP